MILRRCRFIVVCDATTDTDYEYEALAMAIRQIRVDFGVPIDMGTMKFNRDPKAENNCCALGLIRYSCVDSPDGSTTPESDAACDGLLIYIKPSLLGDEPRDVLNYHSTSPTFPQESAADQWFSEAQFESYRALGSHMIETICTAANSPSHDKPSNVLLGSAKVSAAAEAILEELDIQGWIEKLSPTSGPDTAKGLNECIKAVIASLEGSEPAELPQVVFECDDFAKFARKAREHVERPREPTPKHS